MTSAASRSRCSASSAPSDGDPDSSSPSTKTVTPTGGAPPCARNAAKCVAMPALSSAVPRPYSRPSRSVGSNGGVAHCPASPSGCTSWWAYNSTVGAPGGAGCRAMTAGAPPALTMRMSPKPASDNSFDTASALRCTSARRAGSAHTDSMRTSSSRSARTDGSTAWTRATRSLMGTRLVGFPTRASGAKPLDSSRMTGAFASARGKSGASCRTPGPPPPRRCRPRGSATGGS